MNKVPAFTADQLTWLKEQPGPVGRALVDAVPVTDVQNTCAFVMLSAEDQAKVMASAAADKAQAELELANTQAQAAMASQRVAARQAQEALSAAEAAGVDTAALQAAVDNAVATA